MRSACLVVVAFAAGLTFAGEAPVSADLQGYWVPSNSSCKSELGVTVNARSVEFRNKTKRQIVPTESCLTCEGGVRYSGIVVWVTPTEPVVDEFTLYLNADERKGLSKIEFDSARLQSAFPLHNIPLKRCEI
jgi:hypothetical protein